MCCHHLRCRQTCCSTQLLPLSHGALAPTIRHSLHMTGAQHMCQRLPCGFLALHATLKLVSSHVTRTIMIMSSEKGQRGRVPGGTSVVSGISCEAYRWHTERFAPKLGTCTVGRITSAPPHSCTLRGCIAQTCPQTRSRTVRDAHARMHTSALGNEYHTLTWSMIKM